MSSNQQPQPSPADDGPLLGAMARAGGLAGVLLVFALMQLALVALGYSLKETTSALTVIWPPPGLTMVTLWLTPRRYWPAFLATHFLAEFAMGSIWIGHPLPALGALYPAANCLDALVGASIARWLIPDLASARTLQLLRACLGATAVGSATGAVLGATLNLVNQQGFSEGFAVIGFLHDAQVWWLGNWLGSLVVVPLVICWMSPLRNLYTELALRSRIELVLFTAALIGLCCYVFAARRDQAASLLQFPTVIAALMLYAAARLPPRWLSAQFMMVALLCAWLSVRYQGPFEADDFFIRTIAVQTFLVSIGVISLSLSMSLTEKNILFGHLREAEYRYRSFVELSTEAVWRVELKRPMPVTLTDSEQVDWLREHACVVEASRTYEQIEPAVADGEALPWRRESGWAAVYEDQVHKAATQGYSIDGLPFTKDIRGRRRTFLTSFSGVVQDGYLLRIWGVARDISELTELNARLLREQERLKSYARQLMTAEEKARRATAVDLHDGIGQSLVGMAMTLDVARQHSPADVRLLIDEVRVRLREVQERTRHMISDLSPPGLYELGLAPALQWLAVYMRGQDRLHVELEARVREEFIKIETRVLVFKLVRELLRNVVKHAGVNAARVLVVGDAERLSVEVSDQGKGFEWQMDLFGANAGGFGLWSIADRVHEIGGQFSVDTAPGRGSRFEMVFPLRAAAPSGGHDYQSGLRA
ncbi:MAG: MASE1 domain-containing protein [Steroidobacteraceae bacterium]